MTAPNTLLIGDIKIERTWLIARTAQEDDFGAHYNILAHDVVQKTDVIGGIGTLARALLLEDIAPLVLTACRKGDDIQTMIPEGGHFEWKRLADLSSMPMKFNVYERFERETVKLVKRYNTHLEHPPVWNSTFNWSAIDGSQLKLAVVGDYASRENTSLVELPHIKRWLNRQHNRGLPILLRSPHESVIRDLPWTILSVNIHHLANAFKDVKAVDGRSIQRQGTKILYHPALVAALDSIVKKHIAGSRHNKFILLNLEGAGALLIDRDKITPLILTGSPPRWQGIGATDVLLASVVSQVLQNKLSFRKETLSSCRNQLIKICRNALKCANYFSANATKIHSEPNWHLPKLDPSHEMRRNEHKCPVPFEVMPISGESFKQVILESRRSRKYATLLDGKSEIHVSQSTWFLDDYITIDSKLGNEIVRLKKRIIKYLREPGKRPFVGALCGEPGAGKSTLAERLCKAVNCEFIVENAAQWVSSEDLFRLCERIRSVHVRHQACLVFIDEVDSKVRGEDLYGKLLAPLWDAAYFLMGEERTIGPTVFILAGSTNEWKTKKALLTASRNAKPREHRSKLPDLISRLTVEPLEIPMLKYRREDMVYLACWHFLRKYPSVKAIDEGVLRLFGQFTFKHGVRSVTMIVDLFEPKDETLIQADDIKGREDELLLHIDDVAPKGWKNRRKQIGVSV